MFVLRPRTSAGGHYGKQPLLTDLDEGDLRFTTDFRSVYATLCDRWLRVPSADVLGAEYPTLPLLG